MPPSTKSKTNGPLWKGPEQDGITFSLLSRFLCCPERFRLLVVEGLKPADDFNHRIEYGQMWHVCEEWVSRGPDPTNKKKMLWEDALHKYAERLGNKYPLRREQIAHWYNVCKIQFPIYLDYWKKHPDVKDRKVLLPETSFDVPYTLPSGRVVRLRGKWDSVDLIGKGEGAGIYLQENKTKGDVKEQQLQRQLTFDLQMMMYLVALDRSKVTASHPERLGGVRYNVVRRPLSGGKGTIVRHKGSKGKPEESFESYYNRLGCIINDNRGEFFMRWKVEVHPEDIDKFKRQCLDPILERLCVWWDFVTRGDPWRKEALNFGTHYRHPFGVYNVLDEGGSADLDEYLATGSEVGLERMTNLFPELT